MTEPAAHESFDPYHKWLGISPKDQPPHYYRLLAIDLFESDPDVISAAADKQMAFIRSFQAGKNSLFSQKLLNEISAARICLLDPAKKAVYDGTIRARIAAVGTLPGIKRAKPLPVAGVARADEEVFLVAEPADAEEFSPLPLQFGGERSSIRKKKPKSATIIPLVALGAMLVVCVIAVAMVMSRTPDPHVADVAKDADGSSSENAEPAHAKQSVADNRPHGTADPVKPAPLPSPLRPSGSADSSHAVPPPKPPEMSPHDVAAGANHVDGKPDSDFDPFDNKTVPRPEPKALTRPPEAEKPKPPAVEKLSTPEELDRQLADAKTADDYRAVADAALRSAAKAMDDHQDELAKTLIVKALVAARKSNDPKLIIKVTRALTKPESVKEILAEKEAPDAEPAGGAASPAGRDPSEGAAAGESPAPANRTLPAGPRARRISVYGSEDRVYSLGAVRSGTLVTLQYAGGTWRNPTTRESINPDDASRGNYRVALVTRDGQRTTTRLLPTGTSIRPFQWQADRDYDSAIVRCHVSGSGERLTGTVRYQMTISPPGP